MLRKSANSHFRVAACAGCGHRRQQHFLSYQKRMYCRGAGVPTRVLLANNSSSSTTGMTTTKDPLLAPAERHVEAAQEIVEHVELPHNSNNFMIYSDTNRKPFFDTSLAREKLQPASQRPPPEEDSATDEVAAPSPSDAHTHSIPRRRRRIGRGRQVYSEEEKARAQEHLAMVMDKAEMQEPQCLDYPLHTFTDISPAVYRSIKAHMHLFHYVSTRDDDLMRRHFIDREDFYKSEELGKALYLRVVNLHNVTPPADKKTCSMAAKMEKAVLAGVKRIVLEYAKYYIEPFPGEIACDVSHYAAAAPYVAAAKVNVDQYMIDAADLIREGAISKKGVSGAPTSPRRLQPLSPEFVAKEMASRIGREVLRPLSSAFYNKDNFSSSAVSAEDNFGGFRVCIGIAQTPAMAKIGCDAEVLQVERHPEKNAHRVPVRVRSFYQNIRTLRDSKNFMAHFRVAHVPVLTPAFVRFLQVVFKIDTCSQLYEKREELFFNLSKATFDVCYDAVFGRMRFPVEEHRLLYSPENMRKTNEALAPLATNAIAIGNSTRTALRGSALSFTKESIAGSNFTSVDARLNYGRLFTDEQFLALAMKTVEKAVARLQRKGLRASGFRMDVRKGLEVQFVVNKNFPATNSYAQLMAYGREAATALVPHRQQKGVEESGEYFCVMFTLTGLELAVMIPDRLAAEVAAVKKAYIDTRQSISTFQATKRSALKTARARVGYRMGGRKKAGVNKSVAEKQPTRHTLRVQRQEAENKMKLQKSQRHRDVADANSTPVAKQTNSVSVI